MNQKKFKSKTFPKGGVHSDDLKLSADQPIQPLTLPQTVSIPLSQHIGNPAVALVAVGDTVKVGQLIAKADGFISANIHSSVSGKVLKIDDVMDQTGYKKKAVIIQVEGDAWLEGIDRSIEVKRDVSASASEIRAKIAQAGIVGLGGATFPSHVKLTVPDGKKVECLLINGVECEPFLTSDHRLMLEYGEQILIGVQIALKALGLERAMVGIEDNKPDAIAHLKNLAKKYKGIEIHPLKVWYPQGGERQLVKTLMNKEIPPPPKGLPIDVGAIVLNVATCFSIYEAVQKNKPLIERVVTVTGLNLKKPSNFLVRIGTSIQQLIEGAGGLPEGTGKILSGGPMMGKTLLTTDSPVTKGTGGIVLFDEAQSHRKEMLDCIRCAKCISVCPLGLEPYLLMAMIEKNMLERAEEERITNCCECACCAFACPANRPLLDYIRYGKTTVLQRMRTRQQK